MGKHHEYVDDVDYRDMIRVNWDSFVLTPSATETHKKLLHENSDLPYRPLTEKSSDATSDIYNHVIGYKENFPIDRVNMDTESALQHVFNFKLEYSRVLSAIIRKIATLYSLHDAILKYGKFNDPTIILYDEPKNNFHVCLGQQRYYYTKIMGGKIDAIVYSLGAAAAKKIEDQIGEVNWNWTTFEDQFIFRLVNRSHAEFFKSHLMLSSAYDPSRDEIMKEHSENVLDFIGLFMEFGEEWYFYTDDDTYLCLIPNEYAKKKVKIKIKDEFGFIQFALWKICDIPVSDFIMDKRFEVGHF